MFASLSHFSSIFRPFIHPFRSFYSVYNVNHWIVTKSRSFCCLLLYSAFHCSALLLFAECVRWLNIGEQNITITTFSLGSINKMHSSCGPIHSTFDLAPYNFFSLALLRQMWYTASYIFLIIQMLISNAAQNVAFLDKIPRKLKVSQQNYGEISQFLDDFRSVLMAFMIVLQVPGKNHECAN